MKKRLGNTNQEMRTKIGGRNVEGQEGGWWKYDMCRWWERAG